MKQFVNLDQTILMKLQMISTIEKVNTDALIQNIVKSYVQEAWLKKSSIFTDDDKEDYGMLMLLQEADRNEKITQEEIFSILSK